MTFIFLIMVIQSGTTNMQVEPMESMEQCHAAIKAIEIAEKLRSWSGISPRINNIHCIDVQGV